MLRNLLCAAALAALSVTAASAQHATDHRAKVTLVYDQPLPNVPGKSIRGVLVEYEPGGSSPAHTHPTSAFIYATVLQGAIRSQVNDGPVTTKPTPFSCAKVRNTRPKRIVDNLPGRHNAPRVGGHSKMRVNLNADIGESFGRFRVGQDEELMRIIASANIACGMHAGDPTVMHRTTLLANANGVS